MKIDFSGYKSSLKSLDTEEHIDLYFYRPIGYCWALLARHFGITPNAITIASVFLGVGAGVAFYFTNIWVNVLGMLLLVWANSFDSADGQLARMTGNYSRIGRILDGVCGDLWFFAIYLAICLRENATAPFFMEHTWVIWVLGATAGASHGTQASMADHYRQLHLYFLKGEARSELDTSDNLRRKFRELSWSRDFWEKIILFFYIGYTARQEKITPSMQAMRRELDERFPDGRVPEAFRQKFRTMSLPLMKYCNILTFNWRTIALFISLFLGQPWLYFAFELLVMNGLMVYMVRLHEHMCRQLTLALRHGDYALRSLD